MIILRIVGIGMVLVGLLLCFTIVFAPIGIGMVLIGGLLALIGRKSRPIVVQVNPENTK